MTCTIVFSAKKTAPNTASRQRPLTPMCSKRPNVCPCVTSRSCNKHNSHFITHSKHQPLATFPRVSGWVAYVEMLCDQNYWLGDKNLFNMGGTSFGSNKEQYTSFFLFLSFFFLFSKFWSGNCLSARKGVTLLLYQSHIN